MSLYDRPRHLTQRNDHRSLYRDSLLWRIPSRSDSRAGDEQVSEDGQ